MLGGVANEGSSYEDRRVMTPAYRRKYGQKKIPVQNKLPIYNNDGTQPIMNHNGPIFLASGGRPAEDEIQERFHTDRERNLKSFFTDHNFNDGRNEFKGKYIPFKKYESKFLFNKERILPIVKRDFEIANL